MFVLSHGIHHFVAIFCILLSYIACLAYLPKITKTVRQHIDNDMAIIKSDVFASVYVIDNLNL